MVPPFPPLSISPSPPPPCRSAKLHDALPPIGLNLCGGFNLRSQRLRFGLTLSIGEDMTRAGPRTDASVFY